MTLFLTKSVKRPPKPTKSLLQQLQSEQKFHENTFSMDLFFLWTKWRFEFCAATIFRILMLIKTCFSVSVNLAFFSFAWDADRNGAPCDYEIKRLIYIGWKKDISVVRWLDSSQLLFIASFFFDILHTNFVSPLLKYHLIIIPSNNGINNNHVVGEEKKSMLI